MEVPERVSFSGSRYGCLTFSPLRCSALSKDYILECNQAIHTVIVQNLYWHVAFEGGVGCSRYRAARGGM
jgi:predicted nicotinamide N-methyase